MIKKLTKKIFFLGFFLTYLNVCFAASHTVVYIYNDAGVSQESLVQTQHTLKNTLGERYTIRTINAEAVKKAQWTENAALFVMPGGADVPYATKLNSQGNQVIKQYVKTGGSFLGICAGGYYGAGFVEFDKGGALEVIGSRELQFFPGKAVGPALAKYDYQSNSGARAADMSLQDGTQLKIYFNGGAFFPKAADYPNVKVLGWYQIPNEPKLPAILHIKYGKGSVVLSGVHFEYAAEELNKQDKFLAKLIPVLAASSEKRQLLTEQLLARLGLVNGGR